MTREQAQEAFRQNLREFPSLLEQTDRAIDLYVALGMLKLDEPKSAEDCFRLIMQEKGYSRTIPETLDLIDIAGLKIVFK